jgi:hypothetical protein
MINLSFKDDNLSKILLHIIGLICIPSNLIRFNIPSKSELNLGIITPAITVQPV